LRHESVRERPEPGPAAGSDSRVIAVDLGGTKCHGVLADLDGAIVAEDVRATHGDGGPAAALLECIDHLEEAAGASSAPVRAVTVGIPALIDPRTGLASAGPNVDWDGFDVIGLLAERLTVPFEVDNDVNLAAVGQAWHGEGAHVPSFVTLSIGTGIGGAVVVDGKLVRGRYNASGELGYLELPAGRLSAEAARFEDLASGKAIEDRMRALAGVSSEAAGAGPGAAAVFAAAASGDEPARTVVAEVIRHVAQAVSSVVALLDPHLIILDGGIGRSLAPYLSQIREFAEPQVVGYPDVVCCVLEPNATIVGAIAQALLLARETPSEVCVR
jgi:glucokinase